MNQVSISYKTIIFTVFFLLSLWFLYQIRGIIILVFIAYLLTTAITPLFEFFKKIKIPKSISAFLAFLIFLGTLTLLLSGIIPALINQISYFSVFIQNQIKYIDFKALEIDKNFITSQITSQAQTITNSLGNIFKFVLGTASNLIALMTLLVLTFYMMLERANLNKYLKIIFSDSKKEQQAEELVANIEKKLGDWLRGELFLMFIVGLLTYIGLLILGIPFALPIAILAGLLELIPNIGPTITGIVMVSIALTISQPIAIGALILSILVQQLENNIIVPLIMKGAVGLKPIVTLLCMMIGVTIGGIGGAILAIPLFITLQTIFRHTIKYR